MNQRMIEDRITFPLIYNTQTELLNMAIHFEIQRGSFKPRVALENHEISFMSVNTHYIKMLNLSNL